MTSVRIGNQIFLNVWYERIDAAFHYLSVHFQQKHKIPLLEAAKTALNFMPTSLYSPNGFEDFPKNVSVSFNNIFPTSDKFIEIADTFFIDRKLITHRSIEIY